MIEKSTRHGSVCCVDAIISRAMAMSPFAKLFCPLHRHAIILPKSVISAVTLSWMTGWRWLITVMSHNFGQKRMWNRDDAGRNASHGKTGCSVTKHACIGHVYSDRVTNVYNYKTRETPKTRVTIYRVEISFRLRFRRRSFSNKNDLAFFVSFFVNFHSKSYFRWNENVAFATCPAVIAI